MDPELTTHQSVDGQWSFCFRTSTGLVVASGDGYATVDEMRTGIEQAEAVLRLMRKDLEQRDTSSAGPEQVA